MKASTKKIRKNKGKNTPTFIVHKIEQKDLDVNISDFSRKFF